MQFTLEELQALVDMMDAAVRANGLVAAQKALPLVEKIKTMAQEIPSIQEEKK